MQIAELCHRVLDSEALDGAQDFPFVNAQVMVRQLVWGPECEDGFFRMLLLRRFTLWGGNA